MKNIIILIPLLVFAVFTIAQPENNIVIGKTDTVFSKILNKKKGIGVQAKSYLSIKPSESTLSCP